LPFVVRFLIRQLEFLPAASTDPEMPGLRTEPMGGNPGNFQSPVFPLQGNRLVCIREPGMAFDKLTHFENTSSKKPLYNLSDCFEKFEPHQRIILYFQVDGTFLPYQDDSLGAMLRKII